MVGYSHFFQYFPQSIGNSESCRQVIATTMLAMILRPRRTFSPCYSATLRWVYLHLNGVLMLALLLTSAPALAQTSGYAVEIRGAGELTGLLDDFLDVRLRAGDAAIDVD